MQNNRKETLYQMIINSILIDIETGKLKPGDQIPTEEKLSRIFQVSRITSIRAVKELEYRGIVSRTKGKGTFINEFHKHNRLQVKNIKILSTILPFNADTGLGIMRGIEKACKQTGYSATFHDSKDEGKDEEEILIDLLEKDIEGIIIYPQSEMNSLEIFSKFLIKRIPIVFLDRRIQGIVSPCITSNNFQGGYDITNFLINQDHNQIAFVSISKRDVETERERISGYCQALIDAKIAVSKDLIITLYNKKDLSDEKRAELALNKLYKLKSHPTAIVSVNDFCALLLLRAANRRNIRVPEDLSITGFDNIPYSAQCIPSLTTVEQNFEKIGEKAVQTMLSLKKRKIKSDRKIYLDTKIIIRDSVKTTGKTVPS